MVKAHLKRAAAPKSWTIKRKNITFITRPKPGPHNKTLSMPLSVLLKHNLERCKTTKEVKYLLKEKQLLVNGRRRHDHRYPIGLLDVISFPETGMHYVLTIDTHGRLQTIPLKDPKVRLVKIVGKKKLKGGKTQYQFLDGTNRRLEKDLYKRGDSLLLRVDKVEVKEHYPRAKGAKVLLYGGSHKGYFGQIESMDNIMVTIKKDDGDIVQTKREYVVVIGKDKEAVQLRIQE